MRYIFWVVISFFLVAGCYSNLDRGWRSPQVTVVQELPELLKASATDFNLIRKARKATVKIHSVYEEGTHVGSGTLFKYEGKTIVVTAAHVVFPEPEEIKVFSGGKSLDTKVVYMDVEEDLAVLLVIGKARIETICFKEVKRSALKIGTEVVYSGYPNNESLMTIRGYISGKVSNGNLYLHSYGWPGASGSAVLDEKGRVVGVLSAVSIGHGPFGMPSIIEDSVIVVPIWKLELDQLRNAIK